VLCVDFQLAVTFKYPWATSGAFSMRRSTQIMHIIRVGDDPDDPGFFHEMIERHPDDVAISGTDRRCLAGATLRALVAVSNHQPLVRNCSMQAQTLAMFGHLTRNRAGIRSLSSVVEALGVHITNTVTVAATVGWE